MAKFNIINKAEKVVEYILISTEQSPKKIRLDIVPALRKLGLQIIEHVVRANNIAVQNENRLRHQVDCLQDIRVLECFAEIAAKRKYLTNKQFEFLTKLTQELYDMVKNWMNSDQERQK